jgi:hypothetical protein
VNGESASIREEEATMTSFEVPSVWRYRGADKSLARPVTKQATATEDFDFHISYL